MDSSEPWSMCQAALWIFNNVGSTTCSTEIRERIISIWYLNYKEKEFIWKPADVGLHWEVCENWTRMGKSMGVSTIPSMVGRTVDDALIIHGRMRQTIIVVGISKVQTHSCNTLESTLKRNCIPSMWCRTSKMFPQTISPNTQSVPGILDYGAPWCQ